MNSNMPPTPKQKNKKLMMFVAWKYVCGSYDDAVDEDNDVEVIDVVLKNRRKKKRKN